MVSLITYEAQTAVMYTPALVMGFHRWWWNAGHHLEWVVASRKKKIHLEGVRLQKERVRLRDRGQGAFTEKKK